LPHRSGSYRPISSTDDPQSAPFLRKRECHPCRLTPSPTAWHSTSAAARAGARFAARLRRQARRAAGRERRLLERSRAAVAARRARLPTPEFADDLPVNRRRDEIAALIAKHQVVIVCGETGSGKTTQIPKICLELGRGTTGLIGHTQPRRIAARATAARIAQELQSESGAWSATRSVSATAPRPMPSSS
jgi:HrpA-like RNA helicase